MTTDLPKTPPTQTKLADVGITLLLTVGFVCPLLAVGLLFLALIPGIRELWPMWAVLEVIGCVAAGIFLYRRIRARGRRLAQLAAEILVLILLPAWGMLYNHTAHPTCSISSCDKDTTAFRPLAEPEVYALLALHALTILAYAISRRRREALYPPAELLVHATMMVGIVVHVLATIHFGVWAGLGLVIPPLFIPCLSPALTVVLYGIELRTRLSLRGIEAKTKPPWEVDMSPYRKPEPQEHLPPAPEMHRPTLVGSLLLTPVLLGLYAVSQALWLKNPAGALQVFTRTCNYTLSQLPIEVIPQECHYLCTVAAQGHPRLVRPLRMGERGGVPIVVNRQLALANAFEDLLHERWPRFGRLARRVYDRVGLPISRYLRSRWAADLMYLAMKPAEFVFYIALLLLDRGSPEERIDRMYRATRSPARLR